MIKTTSDKTLAKYGLTAQDFKIMLYNQGGVCGICKKESTSGRLNVDHEHIKGWKKLPPEERKKYCRGLLCYICNNRLMTKGVTEEKLLSAVYYMQRYRLSKMPTYIETMAQEKMRTE
jgi:hypothetical protein